MRALVGIAIVCVVALIALGVRWASEHFVDTGTPALVTRDARLSFRASAHLAHNALKAFRALPMEEQRALRSALDDALWPIDRWLAQTNLKPPKLLCIGERHRAEVRRFLAARLLPALRFDVLMLEGAQPWVHAALRAHRRGEPVPALLGAPLAPILEALAPRGDAVQIVGVDESAAERRARRALARADLARRAREDTIVTNLHRRWQPGARHVIVFGALHCRDLPDWFFARLPRESDRVDRHDMLNVVVLARYQEPAIQVLMYLLEEIGLGRDTMVVADTASFPDLVLTWIPSAADAFATYRSAVMFDDRATESMQ